MNRKQITAILTVIAMFAALIYINYTGLLVMYVVHMVGWNILYWVSE